MWWKFLLDHFLIRNPDLTALTAIQGVFNNYCCPIKIFIKVSEGKCLEPNFLEQSPRLSVKGPVESVKSPVGCRDYRRKSGERGTLWKAGINSICHQINVIHH